MRERTDYGSGFDDMALQGKVEEELKALGIPTEGVIIEKSAPFVEDLTLQDAVRPVDAGVQIHDYDAGTVCSLGFITQVTDPELGTFPGVVTAHHCTRTRGAADGDRFYQPSYSTSNYVGPEYLDSPFFTGGSCPPGSQCRYSDAALAYAFNVLHFNRGYIARTNSGIKHRPKQSKIQDHSGRRLPKSRRSGV